jgi:2-polyprenyl-6-methoxyphenol hydroxylase-like FAD-dependent oxidoreductase
MRSVAIIGSGQAGLLAAHGLLRAGCAVTLFSDRTAEGWLHESRPTGTAARFASALSFERALGLAHWEHEAPRGMGVHLTFCAEMGNRLVTLTGSLGGGYFQAIDLRLQCHRWMRDLEERGGRVVIENVTAARLDEIAAAHDLTVVAAGKADLSGLFERDAARSVYDKPQRNLAMLIVRGGRMGFDGVPFLPVKFNLFGPAGEAFWVPYFHKDHGPTWNLVVEAKPGGPLDVLTDAKSGDEMLERLKGLIQRHIPWDWDWARDFQLADERGWLAGRFAPTVRKPFARLPSGRVVMGAGDTVMLFDPVGGQGANNGSRMVQALVAAVEARGDRPFDEAWMVETFEGFYAREGRLAYEFNNLLLEPITPAARQILVAQYGSDGVQDGGRQALANAFIENFEDPRRLTPILDDVPKARALVERVTGKPWWWATARGMMGIARGQLRQKLGLDPAHPRAPAGELSPAARTISLAGD